MAQQRYQGPDGTIYEELPGGGYAVVGPEPQAAPSAFTVGTPSPTAPYEGPKAAVDLESARAKAERDRIEFAERNKPNLPTGYMLGPDGKSAIPIPGVVPDGAPKPKGPDELAGVRNEALDKIKLAKSLIERSRNGWFTTGIGSGIAGSFEGSPAYDVKQDTDTLKNAGALTRIMEMAQMNGGKNPLTPLSNADFQALASSLSNVTPGQSDSQYQANVQRVIDLYQRAYTGAGGTNLEGELEGPAAPAINIAPDEQQQGAIPGAGPRIFDPGTGPGGPQLNGGGRTQTVADPTKAGVAAQMNKLLTSGAPDAEVQAYAQSVGADASAALAFRRKNPGYRGSYNASDLEMKNEEVGGFRGAVNAAAQSPVGAYFLNAADGLSASTLDNWTDNPALARAGLEGVQQANPYSSLAGTISGSALAAAGAEFGLARGLGMPIGRAALTGDALYGAAYGAGNADEGNRLVGAAVGGVAGAGGGYAGRKVAQGVGSALTGIRNPDVMRLRQAGVPLTVGQSVGQSGTVGAAIKGVEDRMSGLPFNGTNARYQESLDAFRPAAVREAVAGVPNGVTATTGREAIEQGRTAVGGAYDSALNGVNLSVDPAYRRELGSALQSANTLPGPLRDTFGSTLQNRVAPQFNGQNIDGRGLQAAVQGLRRDSGDLISRSEVQADLFADRATDVEEALFNLAERQVPGTREGLLAANRANRGLGIVEEASARAYNNGGDFTAAQLGQSIRQNARRFNGMRGLNSGTMPLQGLQEAAQRVLPNAVPDSGTAGRAALYGGLGILGGGGVGGGAGAASGAEDGAASGAGYGAGTVAGVAASLGLLTSKGGQKALTKLLLDRPEAFVRLGEGVQRQSRLGGLFGAPMLAGGATSLLQQ